MVVLEHESLHQTLWGPAAQRGRSKRTDVLVYAQLAMYALLGVCCALEYEKPVAVRLGATTAGTLLYFRNTALFVRLMLLVSCLMLYGDIFLPIKRISTSPQEVSTLPGAQLVLYCIALWNNARILLAIFSSGALRSSSKRAPTMRAKPTMRYNKNAKSA
ncbi:hypothetical protein Gpo141_00006489 [Globisporangium polare]